MTITEVQSAAQRLQANLEKVIYGKSETIERLIVALLCGGHVLLEDVPGTGKTTLARALAKSIQCDFKRIQFAPDLLPSDVTGTNVFNMKTSDFEYRPGPITTNILLADEINRATPRTQSALLEAMEERQVTVDGVTHPLPQPFMVLATQNPVELEGTFPLPEAQIDRFFMKLEVGYPDAQSEVGMVSAQTLTHPLDAISPVLSGEEVAALQKSVRQIGLEEDVRIYAVEIVRETRGRPDLALGASPRGSIALCRAAQAYAAIHGRNFVIPDDIKELAGPVLEHRLILSSQAKLSRTAASSVIQSILSVAEAPVEPLAS